MQMTLKTLVAGSVLPLMLSACGGDPEWKSAYEQCKTQAKSAVTEANAAPRPGEDAQTRAMRESMNNAALTMALSACEMMRAACEDDPKGATCQAIIKRGEN